MACPSGFNEIGTDAYGICFSFACSGDSNKKAAGIQKVVICATPSGTTQIRVNTDRYLDQGSCC